MHPDKNFYDVIWIQWALSHLTDEDALKLLIRCSFGLRDGGLIVLKEKVGEEQIIDKPDKAIIRTNAKIDFSKINAKFAIFFADFINFDHFLLFFTFFAPKIHFFYQNFNFGF